MTDSKRHKELADFLRTRRLRLSPQAAGLPLQPGRRRTQGLRREEVAALSGVSLAWYTYLEQGRPIRVSEQVLESIARTLQLDTDERNYMFVLAGPLMMNGAPPEDGGVPPSLQRMLDDMESCPAYLTDNRWNIIAWNRPACEVFGDFPAMEELGRNLVWRTFMVPEYRRLFQDWEGIAKRSLAQFRIHYAKNMNDPWYNEMVARLKQASPEFAAWWQQHEVFGIPAGRKEIVHPRAGLLAFQYHSFSLVEATGLDPYCVYPRSNYGHR
ncbi:helix-turn-helix transcriptional regulator [Paenibacillus sp. P26]|nr:helix-turn-helix transcriptional regulator [Paenibacillus sp. P26]